MLTRLFGSRLSKYFPLSILDISRTSLIRPRRCSLPDFNFSRYSFTRTGLSACFSARVTKPVIAFIGVRMSWLMFDKKRDFALFAFSAEARASSRSFFWCISCFVSASTFIKPKRTSLYSSGFPMRTILSFMYDSCPLIKVL